MDAKLKGLMYITHAYHLIGLERSLIYLLSTLQSFLPICLVVWNILHYLLTLLLYCMLSEQSFATIFTRCANILHSLILAWQVTSKVSVYIFPLHNRNYSLVHTTWTWNNKINCKINILQHIIYEPTNHHLSCSWMLYYNCYVDNISCHIM